VMKLQRFLGHISTQGVVGVRQFGKGERHGLSSC
jgi:hypothetical protein